MPDRDPIIDLIAELRSDLLGRWRRMVVAGAVLAIAVTAALAMVQLQRHESFEVSCQRSLDEKKAQRTFLIRINGNKKVVQSEPARQFLKPIARDCDAYADGKVAVVGWLR